MEDIKKIIKFYIDYASSETGEDDLINTHFYLSTKHPFEDIIDIVNDSLKSIYLNPLDFYIDYLDETDSEYLKDRILIIVSDMGSVLKTTKNIRKKLKWMRDNKIYRLEYPLHYHIWMEQYFYQEIYYLFGKDTEVEYEHFMDFPQNNGNQKIIWERLKIQ